MAEDPARVVQPSLRDDDPAVRRSRVRHPRPRLSLAPAPFRRLFFAKCGRMLTSSPPRIHHAAQTRKLRARAFAANDITTSHYTAYNFVPKNLWQQFQRVANVYFLLIGMLQLDVFFPGLSPTHWSTTIAPLAFVLSINAAKEAYDDYFRHRSDAAVNATPCVRILRPDDPNDPQMGGGKARRRSAATSSPASTVLETIRWKDLRVGDLALVRNNQELPADVVCVQSSDPSGVGYVETANLDGETNLKAKRACAVSSFLFSYGQLV